MKRVEPGSWRTAALLAIVAGCQPQIERPTVDLVEDDTEETHPHETEDTASLVNARPLCLEAAPARSIAPDLQAWAANLANSTNRFYGELEWKALEALGEDLGDTSERIVMNRITRGWNRLRFGDLDGAVADLQAAEDLAVLEVPRWRGRAREVLGAAWIRKAETDNCITSGSGHACIIPFDAEAIHADPTGMSNAEGALGRCLSEDDPSALSPMWLYNITFMARGMWPDEVPATWALPPGLLDTEAPAEAWTNHAPSLGLKEATLAGGSTLNDFDGDGLLDILVSSMSPGDTMDLYLNNGDGHFCDASDASGVSSIPGLLSFSVADYDNDGDVDVLGPRAAWMSGGGSVRPSLLRNDGEGRFVDVAVEAGLDNPLVNGPTQVGAWADVNLDGWLDVFMGREDDEAFVTLRRVSSLYINQQDGTFIDVGSEAGLASSGFVKGASWLDYDDDGDPDLYVSSLKGKDRLYRNDGDLHFVDVAQDLGVVDPIKSFPSAALDYDQDGRLDLFVGAFTNNYTGGGPLDPSYFQSAESFIADKLGLPTDPSFSETAHLYRNTGGGFEDVTVAVGLDDIHATMGMSFGDMNMDGYPDLFLSTGAPEYDALEPKTFYLNDRGLAFHDVTTATGVGHLQKGHQVSFGDVDEDGDEDVFIDLGGAFLGDPSPPAFFANPSNVGAEDDGHAITLRLEGVTSNRSAIGARVRVITPGRDFHSLVGGTGSFGGNSLQLEVALADQSEITAIEIRWPGGGLETLTEVPLDSVIRVRQGEGIVEARPFAPFKLFHAGMAYEP